jgi:alpha-beta hydrolase superfamily lysophospholipase
MIVAASTILLVGSRSGGRGGFLPWALLVVGSVGGLAANVAVVQPTATGRVIAAWPSFALIAAYEMLMRQVRRNAAIAAGLLSRLSHLKINSRVLTSKRADQVRQAAMVSSARPATSGVAMGAGHRCP